MPRGDKSTEKQKRQAQHIEAGYKRRGATTKVTARRAWATVNKAHGGGKKPGGSGFGKPTAPSPYKKGRRIGGKTTTRHSLAN